MAVAVLGVFRPQIRTDIVRKTARLGYWRYGGVITNVGQSAVEAVRTPVKRRKSWDVLPLSFLVLSLYKAMQVAAHESLCVQSCNAYIISHFKSV